jgi:hypothetical protein
MMFLFPRFLLEWSVTRTLKLANDRGLSVDMYWTDSANAAGHQTQRRTIQFRCTDFGRKLGYPFHTAPEFETALARVSRGQERLRTVP